MTFTVDKRCVTFSRSLVSRIENVCRSEERQAAGGCQLGGAVAGIPISYSVDGRQYVAIAAGLHNTCSPCRV